MLQIKKETANIWECKVDNYANIANFNFVCLSKTQTGASRTVTMYSRKHIEWAAK